MMDLAKLKGKRLLSLKADNDFPKVTPLLRAFVLNPAHPVRGVLKFQKASPIDFADPLLELVPENYLDEAPPTAVELADGIEFCDARYRRLSRASQKVRNMVVKVSALFDVNSGDFHALKELEPGKIPLVSCGDTDNGVMGYYDIPADKQYRDTITVAYNGSWPIMSKFHPYAFGAKDDVAVLLPHQSMSTLALLYVAALLNRTTWRYS